MRRFISLILPLTALLVAGVAFASTQGGAGDDGNPPATLNAGDVNAPGSYAGTVFLEIRDLPDTGSGTPSRKGGRFMRVNARINSGGQFRLVEGDFVCGDAAPADPCVEETICSIGKGNKEVCEIGLVVAVNKVSEIQTVTVSLLIPRIVAAYGLPAGTQLELTKLKEYVQTDGPVVDADGVLSLGAVMDVAFDEF